MKAHIAWLAALVLAAPASAQLFEEVGAAAFPEQFTAPDARSEAMGLAYTAVAEGSAGLWWNPAAQLELRNVQVGWHSAVQVLDSNDFTAMSAAFEMGYLRLGAYQSMFESDLPGAIDDPFHVSNVKSRTRAGGIAIDLGRLIFGVETGIFASAGINFKSSEMKWDDAVQAKANDRDLGIIVGTRRFLGDSDDVHRGWVSWRLGAALVNTDRAWIEFPGEDDSSSLRLLQRGRVGLALEGRHGWRHDLGHALRWLLTADARKTKGGDGWKDDTLMRYGAELTLLGLVSGRVGRVEYGAGSPINGTTYGGGLSYVPPGAFFGLRADYASVPHEGVAGLKTTLPAEPQRLDRYSLSVSLKFWSAVR